ncbi:MAG: hypothetical protein ACJ8BF_01535 [Gemmatimonadales bacterium]
MQRIALLWGAVTLTMAVVSLNTAPVPLRLDSSRLELANLGQEYGELQLWATAIAETADTLSPKYAERARVLADQLARLMRPLEGNFEKVTAALSTDQIETVLPLWERMAFAHAGFVMLQEEAANLGEDPALNPAELQNLAAQLSAVLEFASEIQQEVLDRLTTPPPTPIRAT